MPDQQIKEKDVDKQQEKQKLKQDAKQKKKQDLKNLQKRREKWTDDMKSIALRGQEQDAREEEEFKREQERNVSHLGKKHCAFIWLAEFDINVGSSLRHEYPYHSGIDHYLLAEQMLPAGAHGTDYDFTIWFVKGKDLAKVDSKKDDGNGNDNDDDNDKKKNDGVNDDDDEKKKIVEYDDDNDLYVCFNVVRRKMDKTVKRGANVKALAICTRHKFIGILQHILVLAIDQYYEQGDVKVLEELYNAINSVDLTGMEKLLPRQKRVFQGLNTQSPTYVATLPYLAKMKLRIPVIMEENEVGQASVGQLVQKFKDKAMLIYNALLTEKNIIFLGHTAKKQDLCNFVLACCMMVSPPIPNMLYRCFPFTNLTQLEFEQVPGFVAGVSNPIFKNSSHGWDLFCDISNGEVLLSKKYQTELESYNEDSELLDSCLIDEIILGVNQKYTEEWVRNMFRDYTYHIVNIALDQEEFKSNVSRGIHESGFKERIRVWKETESYKQYIQENEENLNKSPLGDKHVEISRYVRKLQVTSESTIDDEELVKMFALFVSRIKTKQEILEFLCMLPDSRGGIFPIALGLYNSKIRKQTAILLKRIDGLKESMNVVQEMNYYLLLTYFRIVSEMGEQQNQKLEVKA